MCLLNINIFFKHYEYNSSKEYFPNKYFNIDSFALALQINILLLVILYSKIFENCLIKYKYYLYNLKDYYYDKFRFVCFYLFYSKNY